MTPFQKNQLVDVVRKGKVTSAGKFVAAELGRHGFPVQHLWTGVLPIEVKRKISATLKENGVPACRLDPSIPDIEDDGSRAAGLARTGDDKQGRGAVYADRIMLGCLPGGSLRLRGVDYVIPLGVMWSICANEALHVKAKGVILVENKESFFNLQGLTFEVPEAYQDYIVAFRGEPGIARQDTCEKWLEAMALPVVSFPDFDPAGLVVGSRAPGVIGLLWPGADALDEMLAQHGSRDLYDAQNAHAGAAFDELDGDFGIAAGIVRRHRKGLHQERLTGKRPS